MPQVGPEGVQDKARQEGVVVYSELCKRLEFTDQTQNETQILSYKRIIQFKPEDLTVYSRSSGIIEGKRKTG